MAARLVSAPSVPLAPTLPNRPLLIALLLVSVPLAVLLGAACLVLLRQALPSGAGPGGRMVLPPLPPVGLPPELRGGPMDDPGQEPGRHGGRDARSAPGGSPPDTPSPAPAGLPPGAAAGPYPAARPAPPRGMGNAPAMPLGQRRGHPDFAPLPRSPSPMPEG